MVVRAVDRGFGIVHVRADAPGVDKGVIIHARIRGAALHVLVHVRVDAAEDVSDRDADAAGRDGVVLGGVVESDHDDFRLRVQLVDPRDDGVEVLGEHPEGVQFRLCQCGIELCIDRQLFEVQKRVLHEVERVEQREHLAAEDAEVCLQGLHGDHQRLGGVVDADVDRDEVRVPDVLLERRAKDVQLIDIQVAGVVVDRRQAQRAHAVAVIVVAEQSAQVRRAVAAVGQLMDFRLGRFADDGGVRARHQVPFDLVVVVVDVITRMGITGSNTVAQYGVHLVLFHGLLCGREGRHTENGRQCKDGDQRCKEPLHGFFHSHSPSHSRMLVCVVVKNMSKL